MFRANKLFSVLGLLALLLVTLTTPVSAFDGRSGENIVIGSKEVINDDLYVTAATFVLDRTVNGDVIAAGQTLTINGSVDGDCKLIIPRFKETNNSSISLLERLGKLSSNNSEEASKAAKGVRNSWVMFAMKSPSKR